ncbi:MAG: tRNA preQ1(34) S-adenosylmethionine ribosyltransferase-isomerase QueA [Planctomycetota bacterium]
MRTADFDYRLPPELIAQHPCGRRDASRLLVVHRDGGAVDHRRFTDLPAILSPGDLLVTNDTRVFPARLHGVRAETGGAVEVLFLREEAEDRWLALTRSGGKLRAGEELVLCGGDIRVRIAERRGQEGDVLRLPAGLDLSALLEERGEVPLPPYIVREAGDDAAADRERYQTVYARETGAVAAPTAGLHFTEEVLRELEARGISRASLTLHVGPGTFRPVKTEEVSQHRMDAEQYNLCAGTADLINRTRSSGGRVVAVGTTVCRALESAAGADGGLSAASGWTELFITPPYRFKAVDALLTNFHLPRSTLLMLVSAFAGRELVLSAYRQAILERYRFYSYGDCCLLL